MPRALPVQIHGFEMEFGDDCRVVIAVYEDLDEEKLRRVFQICVDSDRRSVGRPRAKS